MIAVSNVLAAQLRYPQQYLAGLGLQAALVVAGGYRDARRCAHRVAHCTANLSASSKAFNVSSTVPRTTRSRALNRPIVSRRPCRSRRSMYTMVWELGDEEDRRTLNLE